MYKFKRFFSVGYLWILISQLAIAQDLGESCSQFEEEHGLVVVEMEHLSLSTGWEIGQAINGYTGQGYIFWAGEQYFNQTGRGPVRFQLKINNPGTYIFNWRVAVGNGTDGTLHNDSWLKIEGAPFYAKKGLFFSSPTKPKPGCQTDPAFACPNGSSANGFFKVFGGGVNAFQWKAQTSDHDAHDVVVNFDSVGVYQVEINARSSFHCIDRLILWHKDLQRAPNAERITNPPSSCSNTATTSLEVIRSSDNVKWYPNPANGQVHFEWEQLGAKTLILRNTFGVELMRYVTLGQNLSINTEPFAAGIYFVEVQMHGQRTTKKLVLR